MRKLYDATVVVGEYTDKSGNQKKKYLTVGTVFEGDKGLSMKLSRAFSPAGVPDKDGSGEIWVNFYEPKDKQPGQPVAKTATDSQLNDDIPF